MNAHVHTYRFVPGALAAWLRDVGGHVASVSSESGFVSGLLLADHAAGVARLVTIWQHELDGQRWSSSNAGMSVPTGLAGPVAVASYEVAMFAGRPGGTAARLFATQLQPDAEETVVSIFQNIILQAATGQVGFQRGLLLLDYVDHRAMSIGLWSSADDLVASERSGYLQRQLALFPPLLVGPLEAQQLQVVIELDAAG